MLTSNQSCMSSRGLRSVKFNPEGMNRQYLLTAEQSWNIMQGT